MGRYLWFLAALLTPCLSVAQTPAALTFDVASVKPNQSDDPANSNFPLGPGDVYIPNGGFFSATNQPLVVYFRFAYKITGSQWQSLQPQFPEWANSERFDIQARAEGNPTKDQMRLMMRSLLADRFKLAIHTEQRQTPVYALLLVKPGTLGSTLQVHPPGSSCTVIPPWAPGTDPDAAPAVKPDPRFPDTCGGLLNMNTTGPGRRRVGARNVAMSFIASSLVPLGDLGRPVVDKTGLSGNFDYALEWAPDPGGAVSVDGEPDHAAAGPAIPLGLTFQAALKSQLGLRLEAQKDPLEFIILDHVERPSKN
jgi:uncharacterized protein (TIGR03435 family)